MAPDQNEHKRLGDFPSREDVEEHLMATWTIEGVRLWWDRPSWQLDGRTPDEAWKQGDCQAVYDVAEQGRGQVAT